MVYYDGCNFISELIGIAKCLSSKSGVQSVGCKEWRPKVWGAPTNFALQPFAPQSFGAQMVGAQSLWAQIMGAQIMGRKV